MKKSSGKTYKPDWTPKYAGKEFAVNVVKGVESKINSSSKKEIKTKNFSEDEIVKGVLKDNRNILARCITLIESNASTHHQKAEQILNKLLPFSGNSIRVGISGAPGAGKSTLIESLGLYLLRQGHKVAVLTVDPSSSVSKGSILGDKTRMEKLSRERNCFIRPSPSGGNLGGVARKTRETITVCEAAGFDVILIETVGVGQSEITVRSMVDFFLLVMIAGAGDELQGIKKGIIEISDALVINKADGNNKQKVELTKSELVNAIHYLRPFTEGWQPKILSASALEEKGIDKIWKTIIDFVDFTKANGLYIAQRNKQTIEWMHSLIKESLISNFYQNIELQKELKDIEKLLVSGKARATSSAEEILKKFK